MNQWSEGFRGIETAKSTLCLKIWLLNCALRDESCALQSVIQKWFLIMSPVALKTPHSLCGSENIQCYDKQSHWVLFLSHIPVSYWYAPLQTMKWQQRAKKQRRSLLYLFHRTNKMKSCKAKPANKFGLIYYFKTLSRNCSDTVKDTSTLSWR